jgi:hypothetical protein
MTANNPSKQSPQCHRCGSFMVFLAVQIVDHMPVDVFRCPSCDTMEAKQLDEAPGLSRTG